MTTRGDEHPHHPVCEVCEERSEHEPVVVTFDYLSVFRCIAKRRRKHMLFKNQLK
jgi:hypothetical protein